MPFKDRFTRARQKIAEDERTQEAARREAERRKRNEEVIKTWQERARREKIEGDSRYQKMKAVAYSEELHEAIGLMRGERPDNLSISYHPPGEYSPLGSFHLNETFFTESYLDGEGVWGETHYGVYISVEWKFPDKTHAFRPKLCIGFRTTPSYMAEHEFYDLDSLLDFLAVKYVRRQQRRDRQ